MDVPDEERAVRRTARISVWVAITVSVFFLFWVGLFIALMLDPP